MQYVKALALLLLIVGGINWLLVGVMEFDLVASLTGSTFGETNPISTIVYTLVGLSALVLIPTLVSWLSGTEQQAVTAARVRNIPMKRSILSIAAALLAATTLTGTAAAASRPDVACMQAGIRTLQGAGLLDDVARGGIAIDSGCLAGRHRSSRG